MYDRAPKLKPLSKIVSFYQSWMKLIVDPLHIPIAMINAQLKSQIDSARFRTIGNSPTSTEIFGMKGC